MQEYELSFLYLPPKDWPLRAEDWHDQVDKIIAYTRQTIAQEIEHKMVCHCPSIEFFDDWCVHKEAAAIARGKNE